MPCTELFDKQDAAYRESVLPSAVRRRIAVEAATPDGWWKYVGLDGAVIGMNGFGASAPASALFQKFGITTQAIVDRAKAMLTA
jgi:transketolase